MNTQKIRRYPGVQPFKEHQEHLFFGREEDKQALLNLVLLEKMTILFGKSGYGKSSLLNAAIMPALRADAKSEFQPIEIRFFQWNGSTNDNLLEKFLAKLRDATGEIPTQNQFLNHNKALQPTLWLECKRRQRNKKHRFIFVFDQFEEFFSYPLAQQETFKRQFADVLFQDYPDYLWDDAFSWTDEEAEILTQPLHCKSVFSIRADRMSYLDSLKDALPTILHKRYELRPLTPEQAREAIVKPAEIVDNERFVSPAFEFTPEALQVAIAELTKRKSDTPEQLRSAGVEAFQLQILCEYIESLVLMGNVPDIDGNGLPDITAALLPRMETLYEDYYRRKLQELAPAQVSAARRVLEDGLLTEDASTGEGRRMSVDSRSLLSQFRSIGLDDALLEALEKTYLLRREVNTVGGFSFEISHDTLIAPIQKAKDERKTTEEEQRKIQEAADKAAELATAKSRLRTTQGLLAVAFAALIAAGYFGYNAKVAKEKAEVATMEANYKNKQFLNEKINTKSLEINDLQRKNEIYKSSNDLELINENKQKVQNIEQEIEVLKKEIEKIAD